MRRASDKQDIIEQVLLKTETNTTRQRVQPELGPARAVPVRSQV